MKHPTIAANWRRHWAEDFCTTNVIESLNMLLRRALTNRGRLPSEPSHLLLLKIVAQFKTAPTHWDAAVHQLALKSGKRSNSPSGATENR